VRESRASQSNDLHATGHNDLGLAVRTHSPECKQARARWSCAINALASRAGNASLEEIVMAMRVRPDRYPYETASPASTCILPADVAEITQGSRAAQTKAIHRPQCV